MGAKRMSIYLIIALLLALLAVPSLASAKATVKHCLGVEIFDDVISVGDWTFPDGNIHVRGRTSRYLEQMDCEETSGTNIVTMNANWDANYAGPIWGTSLLTTPYALGGVWSTTWHGKTFPDGTFYYKAVGRGVSGSVEGLKIRVYAYGSMGGPTFVEVTILDPHRN